jgi:N-carbamoyl-L-amino-acid hydrolase
MISKQRLAEQLKTLENFSSSESGITRLAFSDEDWQARSFIIETMTKAGLSIRTDAFGNVIGRLEGLDPKLPAIMSGSHADSVPQGGNYDGIVGILCAIEAITSLKESGWKNDHAVEIVLFMAEESSRFGTATLGSKAMRGKLTREALRHFKDKNSISLYQALSIRGLSPDLVDTAKYTAKLKAFFEVHIEQGKVLEYHKKQIGIVTGIAAPTRLKIHLHGQSDHSGGTPMELRHDCLCGAAEIVLAVEKFASIEKSPPAVATVGILDVKPGVMNVIPGDVELGIDIRSICAETKTRVTEGISASIASICEARGLEFETTLLADEAPASIQPQMLDFFEEICRKQQVDFLRLPSGAGHDAMHWTDYTHTGMVFIPCRAGISHNPAEYAKLEDIAAAASILAQAIQKVSSADFSWPQNI